MKCVLASRQDPYSHADGWGEEDPLGFQLDMIAQHELLVRMAVDLLVYPTLRWAQAPSREPDAGSGGA